MTSENGLCECGRGRADVSITSNPSGRTVRVCRACATPTVERLQGRWRWVPVHPIQWAAAMTVALTFLFVVEDPLALPTVLLLIAAVAAATILTDFILRAIRRRR